MSNKEWHASPQELLLFADGELSPRRASLVRAHLAACWDCRTRIAEIDRTIADFVRIHPDP
jgi:anti-sigma factor RsiW